MEKYGSADWPSSRVSSTPRNANTGIDLSRSCKTTLVLHEVLKVLSDFSILNGSEICTDYR